MKRLLVLLAATGVAASSMAVLNYTDSVHWDGTGDWTDSNWSETAADTNDVTVWNRPGWVVGNPANTNSSTDVNWNRGYAHIDSGTLNITPTSHPDGNVRRIDPGSNIGNTTINISTDFTVQEKVYAGYASRVQDVATVNQTAGNVAYGTSAASRTYWGRGKGQTIYNLSGGTMATPGDWDLFGNNVTDSDDGASTFTFNQTGGTFTDTGAGGLVISDKKDAISVLNISGGTFNANDANTTRIGHYGTSTMNVSGADTVVSMTSKEVGIGYYASSTVGVGYGEVNMTNGTFTAANADAASVFSIGRSGSGTFNLVDGTVDLEGMNETFVGRYKIADVPVQEGILNVSAGTFKANRLHVGRNGTGTINQTGGTITMAAYSTLGMYDGATATVNLDGGTMEITDATTVYYLGRSGVATFNQTGGAFVSAAEVSLGRYNAATGSGTLNLSGGTFTVSDDMYVGYEGNGTLIQTGGDLDVYRFRLAQEDDANAVTGTGFYSISGGSLLARNYITGGYKGDGVFEVIGSGATSISSANISFYDDTLRIILDDGGSTLLVADKSINTAYNGQIDIRGVVELGTTNGFSGAIGDVFDLGWASDTILTNELTTLVNLGGVEFELGILENVDQFGNAGTGQMLQATVIPEPATLGVMALFGGAMLWIRRFRN